MKRFLGALVATALLSATGSAAPADDKDATPIIDKAVKALGGEEKVSKAATSTWRAKGTITINGDDNPIKTRGVVQGLDRQRAEFEGEFNGNEIKGVTVLNGNKGWRKFGDDAQELDSDMVANAKHTLYLHAISTTVLPLKGKGFKVEAAPEEKVGDKPAAVVKGTGPDGKDFTIYFDKETGLPVKMTATVKGFQGEDFVQESTFANYKDFDGFKKATKLEAKRDGNAFMKSEITEFKVLDKVEAGEFDEPK